MGRTATQAVRASGYVGLTITVAHIGYCSIPRNDGSDTDTDDDEPGTDTTARPEAQTDTSARQGAQTKPKTATATRPNSAYLEAQTNTRWPPDRRWSL